VTLDGIEITSDPRSQAPGYTLSAWDGWTGGAEVAGGAVPWEAADDGVRGDVWLQGRSVALSGLIRGQSAADTAQMMEALGGVLTRTRWGQLVVDEEHLRLSRQLTVARGGRVIMDLLTPTIATWALTLQSPDSRRVSTQQSAVTIGAGTPLVNAGNMYADLTLVMTGPLTNPGISWPGGAWQYGGTIAPGVTLNVDMARRVVRNPATTQHFRRLAQGTWLSVPPGSMHVNRTGTGDGTISARWRSSWA